MLLWCDKDHAILYNNKDDKQPARSPIIVDSVSATRTLHMIGWVLSVFVRACCAHDRARVILFVIVGIIVRSCVW